MKVGQGVREAQKTVEYPGAWNGKAVIIPKPEGMGGVRGHREPNERVLWRSHGRS